MNNEKIRTTIIQHKQIRIIKGIKVPTIHTNHYCKVLRKQNKMININNLKKVYPSNEQSEKIILIEDNVNIGQILKADQKDIITSTQMEVELMHNNFTTQQIFNWFHKDNKIVVYPNSFESVGHLAHFNLTTQQIPYKEIIGEITLIKSPSIKTVVNKTEKLHNVYRTPTLQFMAGVHNYQVKLKQGGVQFEFDFQKVYWCSKLQQERDRLLQMMSPNQILFDIFCGVGPLAIRSAKKGIHVLANDLNPFCYDYLIKNSALNKVQDKIVCWNKCARIAMETFYSQKEQLKKIITQPDHIYMNLPVDAIQFLNVFKNYKQQMKTQKMPLIHVNCFVVANNQEQSLTIITERIKKILPGFQHTDVINLHHIKNVTVIMRMECVTFKLKAKYEKEEEIGQQGYKKIKLNENL